MGVMACLSQGVERWTRPEISQQQVRPRPSVLSFLDDRTPVENKIGRIINKDKDDNKKMLVQAGHKLEIPCMTRAAKWNTKSQTGHAPKCNVETMQWTKHSETLN
jgi:hypothetical protein